MTKPNTPWLTATLILLAAAVFAHTAQAKPQPNCTQIATVASAVMFMRQSGDSLEKALSAAEGNVLLRQMVLKAWGMDRQETTRRQKMAVEDFRDRYHLACVKMSDNG